MNNNEERKRKEMRQEVIANIIVAILCGIVGMAIAFGLYVRYSRSVGSISGLVISVLTGFFVGSSYGLWHAIEGWKKYNNDLFNGDDD